MRRKKPFLRLEKTIFSIKYISAVGSNMELSLEVAFEGCLERLCFGIDFTCNDEVRYWQSAQRCRKIIHVGGLFLPCLLM